MLSLLYLDADEEQKSAAARRFGALIDASGEHLYHSHPSYRFSLCADESSADAPRANDSRQSDNESVGNRSKRSDVGSIGDERPLNTQRILRTGSPHNSFGDDVFNPSPVRFLVLLLVL